MQIFIFFQLHTHVSDFSGSVKLDFTIISHFILHTFMTVSRKLHTYNHKMHDCPFSES